MNQRSPIVKVEISTMFEYDFDSKQLPKLVIFLDPQGRYHFGRGLDDLKRAITSMSLEPDPDDEANRHLLFNLKVLRGTRIDAYLDAVNRDIPRPRKRRTNRDRYL